MKHRLIAVLALVVILLSACSSGGKVSTGFQYLLEPPAEPLQVQIDVDGSRAAEVDITTAGGSLEVAGADGTRYRLDIPADALLNDTHIRMTPANVSGLPFGGNQTLAVQLEPEGLAFSNFVTLTILPAQEIPIDQQIFFGYEANGSNLSLAAPVVNSAEIKLQLLHFSGYGVTKGLLADIEPVRARIGGSAETRLQSAIAEQLARERQRQLLGGGESESLVDFEEYFRQYEEQVIKPRLAAAGESCAAGRLALQTVLGFERQKALLGVEGAGSLEQYGDLMATVSRVCVKEEYELCRDEHVIHRMIPVWLGMERQAQLLGMGDSGGALGDALREARDLTAKCLTFELVFESQANFDDGSGGGYDSSVESKIKVRFNPDEISMKGQSALVNKTFEFKTPGCSVTSNRGGGTFDVASLAYIDDAGNQNPLSPVRDFSLTYFPGMTSEFFTVVCEDSPPYTSPPNGMWSGVYLVLHQDELDLSGASGTGSLGMPMPDLSGLMGNASGGMSLPSMTAGMGFKLTDWEVTGGEYYAKKEWIKEDGSLGIYEAGTMKLYHRPGQ